MCVAALASVQLLMIWEGLDDTTSTQQHDTQLDDVLSFLESVFHIHVVQPQGFNPLISAENIVKMELSYLELLERLPYSEILHIRTPVMS